MHDRWKALALTTRPRKLEGYDVKMLYLNQMYKKKAIEECVIVVGEVNFYRLASTTRSNTS